MYINKQTTNFSEISSEVIKRRVENKEKSEYKIHKIKVLVGMLKEKK